MASCNHKTSTECAEPPIYVVDDDNLLRDFAVMLVEQAGLSCRAFTTGEAALAAFIAARTRPALIVTDYAMGNMNGLQLLEQCKQLEPGLRTILVSGTVKESVLQETRLKVDRFLAKPYRTEDFINEVNLLLKRTAS